VSQTTNYFRVPPTSAVVFFNDRLPESAMRAWQEAAIALSASDYESRRIVVYRKPFVRGPWDEIARVVGVTGRAE
jgi:hypothetical protein